MFNGLRKPSSGGPKIPEDEPDCMRAGGESVDQTITSYQCSFTFLLFMGNEEDMAFKLVENTKCVTFVLQ